MGFRRARDRLLACLREGRIAHWPRRDAFRKNWLETGRLAPEAVVDLVQRCRGLQHRESPHDFDPASTVHEFFPDDGTTRWYVKVFFDADAEVAVFISVHPSGH